MQYIAVLLVVIVLEKLNQNKQEFLMITVFKLLSLTAILIPCSQQQISANYVYPGYDVIAPITNQTFVTLNQCPTYGPMDGALCCNRKKYMYYGQYNNSVIDTIVRILP